MTEIKTLESLIHSEMNYLKTLSEKESSVELELKNFNQKCLTEKAESNEILILELTQELNQLKLKLSELEMNVSNEKAKLENSKSLINQSKDKEDLKVSIYKGRLLKLSQYFENLKPNLMKAESFTLNQKEKMKNMSKYVKKLIAKQDYTLNELATLLVKLDESKESLNRLQKVATLNGTFLNG